MCVQAMCGSLGLWVVGVWQYGAVWPVEERLVAPASAFPIVPGSHTLPLPNPECDYLSMCLRTFYQSAVVRKSTQRAHVRKT